MKEKEGREGTQRETEIKQDKHKVWHTEEG